MSGSKTFYYFGDDEAYFRTLVGEFKKYSSLPIDFKKVFESEEAKIQSLFLLVNRTKPQCVFIDFSKRSNDYLHLARILTRTLREKNILVVGLLDYLSPPEVMLEGMATGANLTHIKSAEVFDVVYSVLKLLKAQDSVRQTFATAKYEDQVQGGIPVKIGFVNHSGIHIESDLDLEIGDKVKIEHFWQKKRIVPSSEFIVKNSSQKNLYYQFKNAFDLDFLFIDEPDFSEEMTPEEFQLKKDDRDEKVHYHTKILERWIRENGLTSLEKKAKVLSVDRHFNFYNMQSRTDKHSYNIRCIESLGDIGTTIDRYSPQVIAYSLDLEDDSPLNTEKELALLVQGLKVKMGEDLPFLVIFNSRKNSKTLQEELQFPHIVASEADVSVDLLLRMADVFEKKLLSKLPKQNKKDNTVFIKSSNEASLGQFQVNLVIKQLSEIDMIIQSERPLKIGTNIYLKRPVEMFINIQESKESDKAPIYNGIIHCIGEVEKTELRKYINSVIFREHDAKVAAEIEEFKRLNEEKLQEKEAKKTEEDPEIAKE